VVLNLCRFLALILMVAAMGLAVADQAFAHKDHDRQRVQELKAEHAEMMSGLSPDEQEAMMEAHLRQMAEAEPAKPFRQRLINWTGRLHPFAVHFPIALFPIAWVSLLLARRRGETGDLIRSLIVVGGGAAVIATLLGWLNGGFQLTDADPVLVWHRWVGTVLGLAGGAVAIWAWRSETAMRTRAMAWTLGLITAGLLAQGWLGGALIHGIDHLNW
jgi:uncharacterized membrane protein